MNAPSENSPDSKGSEIHGSGLRPGAGIELARELLHTLNRTVKTLCLYPEDNAQSVSASRRFYAELTAYLQEHLQLDIEVHPRELLPQGDEQTRPEEAESLLPIRCHEAGITGLSFTHPFPEENCLALLSILRACLTSEGESTDLTDALWGESIDGFRYEVVDDLEFVEYDEALRDEYFSSSMSGNNNSLYQKQCDALLVGPQSQDSSDLDQNSELIDTAPDKICDDNEEGRVGQQDWPTPQQFRTRSLRLTDFESRTAREYIQRDEAFDTSGAMFDLGIDLLNEKQELVDFVETLDICLRLHTDLVERGSMRLAAKVVNLIRTSSEKFKDTTPVWSRKANEAIAALSSRQRLNRVSEALNRLDSVSGAEFGEYLHVFDWTAYSGLTEMLGNLEHKNHRLALCAFLSEADDEHIDLLASGIYDKRWYVVRNAVNILLEFNTPRAHKHIQKALTHDDIRIRELILSRCNEQSPDFSCKVLEALVSDRDESIRDRALSMALSQTGAHGQALFAKLIEEQTLAKLSPKHQQMALNGFAITGGEKALESLTALAKKWSILESGDRQSRREQFIQAISSNGSDAARKALKSLSRSWNGNIKKAAKQALKSHSLRVKESEVDGQEYEGNSR